MIINKKILPLLLSLVVLQVAISQEKVFEVSSDQPKNFRQVINSKIIYPEIARELGIGGKVVSRFRINRDGCIDSIIVIESPDTLLSKSVVKALNDAKCGWVVTINDEIQVESWWSFDMNFSVLLSEVKGQFSSLESALKKTNKVEFLELKDKNYSEIPYQIFTFKNLFTLDLEDNKITKVPKDIVRLKKMQFLLLAGNQIHSLPAEIKNLKKMYKIDLSNNRLDSVPNEVFSLVSIWELNVSNNNIKELPSNIKNLKKLRYLNLSYNKLNKLPEEFFELKKLYEINLKGNNFSDSEKDIIRKHFKKATVFF